MLIPLIFLLSILIAQFPIQTYDNRKKNKRIGVVYINHYG